ncbi:chorismate--pyruvate lyase family protein [Kangiella geojedonensis]|uniref:Probable chorismate pyruvate-lyase n=1 Tax=Kangiella geojedonensis TaxID=914150 RepID=A0A0F6TP88_9GAMM|nr:chorismate lyase [Kangiella geojedonensis]AKE51042.1 Putative chorismate pyruvate-lyase [Kangiella geojedonensis]
MDFKAWRRATDDVIRELPYQVAEWVAEFGSLTQKLSHYVDEVRLDLLKEATEQPTQAELQLLELNPATQSQVREVVLHGPDKPWIYARTVVPVSESELILDLGTTPLGSILFTSSELRRVSLEVMQIDPEHRLYQQAREYIEIESNPSDLWARRSLWANRAADKKLLLLEVFLPDSPLYK